MGYTIHCCGSNGSYQLGLGNDEDQYTLQTVRCIIEQEKPKKMAFGGNHTLILYPNGNLYAAGDNTYGQCGCEEPQTLREFSLVAGKWTDISAGWEFSVFCDAEGQLYSCGRGLKGELGLGDGITQAKTPQRIDTLQDLSSGHVVQLVSSISHTLVRYSTGEVSGWGACRKGQLGPQEEVFSKSGKLKARSSVWSPVLLDTGGVGEVFVGRDRTVLKGDTVRVWGQKVPADEDLAFLTHAKSVRTMWSSIHYLKDNHVGTEHGEGPVYSFGNNSHGQLYRYGDAEIQALETGSEHGLILLSSNEVKTWGWGEHGNCGPLVDGRVTFDRLSTIYSGADRVVMLGGGMATSWVVTVSE